MDQEEEYLIQKELVELKHKYKMEELAYERENAKLFVEGQLTIIRIKSAEIKRTQQAKEYKKDFERYAR